MSGYCRCGVYHEEDDGRLCSKCRDVVEPLNLSFGELAAANDARGLEWNPKGVKFGIEFALLELFGEVGELANQIKKQIRSEHGLAGGSIDRDNMRRELADVVITADLLARKLNIDLGSAVVEKFNLTSDKHGFKTRLGPREHQHPEDSRNGA